MRIMNPVKKPLFTPNLLMNKVGVAFSVKRYGSVFFFVGTMKAGDSDIPALAIADWSRGWKNTNEPSEFIKSAMLHNETPIDATAFIKADDRLTHGTSTSPRHPLYALTNPSDILNLIAQIRAADEDLPEPLLSLEETAKASIMSHSV